MESIFKNYYYNFKMLFYSSILNSDKSRNLILFFRKDFVIQKVFVSEFNFGRHGRTVLWWILSLFVCWSTFLMDEEEIAALFAALFVKCNILKIIFKKTPTIVFLIFNSNTKKIHFHFEFLSFFFNCITQNCNCSIFFL
jgi:hypothetical protein